MSLKKGDLCGPKLTHKFINIKFLFVEIQHFWAFCSFNRFINVIYFFTFYSLFSASPEMGKLSMLKLFYIFLKNMFRKTGSSRYSQWPRWSKKSVSCQTCGHPSAIENDKTKYRESIVLIFLYCSSIPKWVLRQKFCTPNI